VSAEASRGICIVGGDGMIGRALQCQLAAAGVRHCASTRRAGGPAGFFFDLERSHAKPLPGGYGVVVLTAAMTRLSDCRAQPAMAHRLNVEAPVEIAKRAFDQGAAVLFLSTNQVFDGSRPSVPPEHPLNPRSLYGKLKAEAEERLRALGGALAILRLGKVIGPGLALFDTWRGELGAGRPIRAFEDLKLAPVAISKVAHALQALALSRMPGTFHLSCNEEIAFADAARHLALRVGAGPALVISALAADANVPEEERPPHVSLAPSARAEIAGIRCQAARVELDLGLGFDASGQK
jgi:dTDP-4-dehydrorhamnose reductase